MITGGEGVDDSDVEECPTEDDLTFDQSVTTQVGTEKRKKTAL